jgi:hypothetical protein
VIRISALQSTRDVQELARSLRQCPDDRLGILLLYFLRANAGRAQLLGFGDDTHVIHDGIMYRYVAHDVLDSQTYENMGVGSKAALAYSLRTT